ncbi:MAG: hypothetical protein NWE76_10355, partial [Candidatus Bathyarchaeota archaeon]|nr:hypothetical protein [Candidatus Bathyarchaeota archaeon]
IRGLTLQKRHEDVISLMRGTVSKKQFKELANSHNFSPDIIPKSRKTEADIILKGMTPKEKFQTLRTAMAGLESKRARQTTATLQRKEDTQAASMAGKVIPDAEFNDILADVERIPNMDESRKLRHVQDLFNSRSIGQAVQEIAVMDEKDRTPQNVKKVMEDKIAANKEILAKRIDHRIATAGITGANVSELRDAKNQLDDVAFNLRESTTMVNQAVTMANGMQEALIKDPVAYGAKYSEEFKESITQAKTTDPASVKKMIADMDSFYDQVGLDKSDRKYISNDISEEYAKRLNNQPGAKAREVIQEIHDVFGIEKSRDVMDSIADRGHIKDSMVTASFYEKVDAQTAAINLLQKEGDLKQFNPLDTEITDYNKKIEEVVAPLRRAMAHSDRTASNARVANGVKKHIDLFIRSEAPQTDAQMKESLDKAKKLFIDNEHIVGEGPKSNMYVSASSGVTKEQLDDFMDYVSDAEGLELLAQTEGVEIEINKSISEAGTPEEQKRLGLSPEEVKETWEGMADRRMRLVNSGGDYFRPTIVNPRTGQQQSIALKNGEKFRIPISKIPGLIERMEAKAVELHQKKNPPGPFIRARIEARARAREGGERIGRKFRGSMRTAIEEIQKIQVVPSGPPDPFTKARSKARAKARAVDILPDIELSASARAAARRKEKEGE